MPIFRKAGVALLYIHVPKTGGTSVEDLFINSGWEVDFLDRGVPGWRILNEYRRCSPQHYHSDILSSVLRLETFDHIFMTVREPEARFCSEIVMRKPDLIEPWNESTDEYVRNALRLVSGDPFLLDNHLRPQHEFYVPGASVHRLEDGLDAMVEWLRSKCDVDIPTEIPWSTAREGSMPGSGVRVPEDLRRSLKSLYALDYRLFGYEV